MLHYWSGYDFYINPSDLLNISNKNGILTLNKNKTNGIGLVSMHSLRLNEACLGLFHYNGDTGFTFSAQSGEWQNSTLRGWGTGGLGLYSFYQLGQQEPHYIDLENLLPGHWYYNLLWFKDQTTFVVRVWEKDNPKIYAEKIYIMNDPFKWAKRAWTCSISVSSGTYEIGSYQELRFDQTP